MMNNFKIFVDILKNIFLKYDIVYIVETADWSIKWDGFYLSSNLKKNRIKSRTASSSKYIKNSIIHFGSVNTFINENGIKKVDKSNKIILTWFHITENDKRIKFIPELNNKVDLIHTSCQKTKELLIKYGLKAEKIVVIALGVDINIFKKYSEEKREKIRNKLNLPNDKIIIGSFQKDGQGWGEGLKPKLEKGPDIFCDVVEKMSKEKNIHILLTGPARGYVKKRLDEIGVSYTHNYIKNYLNIVDYYNCLDLYLVTSRAEGGPKAILESMATGVPFITTDVGLVSDILENDKNTYICSNTEELFEKSIYLLGSEEKKEEFVRNNSKEIKKYSWEKIVEEYFNKIYKKFL
ncbi:MAG: glycosyltransferase family 4 protein [Patescibacteria group bacterium]|jgi:glycosyltransferase involved in cell wall biosynthesis